MMRCDEMDMCDVDVHWTATFVWFIFVDDVVDIATVRFSVSFIQTGTRFNVAYI